MKLQDYIDRLYAAGWDSPSDAQWGKIEAEFRILFPLDAALEDMEKERDRLESENTDLIEALQEFIADCDCGDGTTTKPFACTVIRAKELLSAIKGGK
jgi:hypothetical protein